MFSADVEITISRAYKQARKERRQHLCVAQLALALLELEVVQAALAPHADTAQMQMELKRVVEDTVPSIPIGSGDDTQPTVGFQRVLQRAVYAAQSAGQTQVSAAHLLIALPAETRDPALAVFRAQQLDRPRLLEIFDHPLPPDTDEPDQPVASFRATIAASGQNNGNGIEARLKAIEDRLAAIEQLLTKLV